MAHEKPMVKVFPWSGGWGVPLQATTPMTKESWESRAVETRNRMKAHRHIKEQWEKGEFLKDAHEIKR